MISALGVTFAFWGLAIIPGWFVVREIGIKHFGPERAVVEEDRKRASLRVGDVEAAVQQ